jgi:hypothetical protein
MSETFSGSGFIEFHGTLADLEQAVGLRIEREGEVLRAVPLERPQRDPHSSPQPQNEMPHPTSERQP